VRYFEAVIGRLKSPGLERSPFMPSQIIPVIMCGGVGTRLWPVSRESMPKQFVHLVGQCSTFQQVIRLRQGFEGTSRARL
jgi:Nucleotidyl transferase